MCMLYVVNEHLPPEDHMEAAERINDDGIGVAWRVEKKGESVVKWKKGLGLKETLNLIKDLPKPFIVHMRKASQGGKFRGLNHPFPVTETSPLSLSGELKGYVLAHNGTWGGWREFMRDLVRYQGKRIPPGPWSDSRAFAWIMANYGEGALEMVMQDTDRVVLFGPTGPPLIYNLDKWDIQEGWSASQKLSTRVCVPSFRGEVHDFRNVEWDSRWKRGRGKEETTTQSVSREEVVKVDVSKDPDIGLEAKGDLMVELNGGFDSARHFSILNVMGIVEEIMRLGVNTSVQDINVAGGVMEEVCVG